MNILTWHGAIIRVDQLRNRLVQEPLWLTTADETDFTFDPDVPLPLNLGMGVLTAEPTGRPRVMRLCGASGVLSASPTRHELSLEPEDGQPWQSFLLLSPSDVADLRHILNNRWRIRPNNQWVEKSAIRIAPGFSLELGTLLIDLPATLPLASHTRRAAATSVAYAPPPSFVLQAGDDDAESIEMAGVSAQNMMASQYFQLAARRKAPEMLDTPELFSRGNFGCFTVPPAPPRYAAPPVMARAQDRAAFEAFLNGHPAGSTGLVQETCRLRREPNQFVVLSRGCEGLVFDQDGTSCDMGPLETAHSLPPGIARRGNGYWVDRDALATAPRVPGPLMVFYGGHLDCFTDWLAGALPALDVLSRNVPRSTRLLLPAHTDRGHHHHRHASEARFNHRETLVQLGYNRLPSVQSEADIVLAEDVVFMDSPTANDMPAAQLAEFRQHALLAYDGLGEPTRRLFIRTESGGIEERGDVERFLLQQGFEPVELDNLGFDQQIKLFRQAAFVVSPHHGGLSHLVFSTPGLKVLELVDEGGFAPDFWRLCGKLGHVYGFMGCRSVATPMGPRLAPDAERFRYLFKVLEGFTA
jgi:hypothetical protein